MKKLMLMAAVISMMSCQKISCLKCTLTSKQFYGSDTSYAVTEQQKCGMRGEKPSEGETVLKDDAIGHQVMNCVK